jgi:hypothetical protein
MTQDELTKLINEFLPYPSQGQHYALRQFANLVAQHAKAEEREACAFDAEWCIENHLEHHIPERIRGRGNK